MCLPFRNSVSKSTKRSYCCSNFIYSTMCPNLFLNKCWRQQLPIARAVKNCFEWESKKWSCVMFQVLNQASMSLRNFWSSIDVLCWNKVLGLAVPSLVTIFNHCRVMIIRLREKYLLGLEHLFKIWPFKPSKIGPMASNICQIRFKYFALYSVNT